MTEEAKPKRKPTTIKELEKRHNDLEAKVDQVLDLLKEAVGKEEGPKADPQPAVPQFKYMFVSPHARFKLRLKPGRRVDQGYGEFVLIPPVFGDFSTDSPGPEGFWGTNDDEEAAIARRELKKIKDKGLRQQFTEVTNDPTFDLSALTSQKPGIKGRPEVR